MTYQATILADNPVFLAPLNESSGTTATDVVSANNGTHTGGFTQGNAGLVFEAGGLSTVYNGTTGYTVFPNAVEGLLNGAGAVVVEVWLSTATASGSVVEIPIDGTSIGFRISVGASGVVSVGARSVTGDTLQTADTSATGFNDGLPHHAVFKCDFATGKWSLTVDDAVQTLSTATPTWANSTWTLGTVTAGYDMHVASNLDHSGGFFTNKVQYVALYTSDLSSLRIRKHYQAGLATGLHREILDLGPTFYAPLNEGSGDALDWSGNDNNGTLNGGVTQGAAGGLAYDDSTGNTFDGAGSSITLPATVDDTLTNSCSFGCLIKFTSAATNKALGGTQGAQSGIIMRVPSASAGKLEFQVLNTTPTAYSITSANTFNDGVWHLVVGVADGTNVIIYVDGVQEGINSTMTGNINKVTTAFTLMEYSTTGNGLAGDAQSFFFFDSALTPAQNRRLAMAARTLIEDRGYPKVIANLTPSFYARLGEASGTTVFDESGNDNDGTINGSPTLATANGPLHQSRLKAMTFDGVDDYVQTTYAGQTGSQNRTLLCWFKMPATTGAKRVIASYGTNTANQLFEVHVDTSGNFGVDCNTCSALGDTVLSADTLYFGAVVLNGTTANDFAVYINGAVETEAYTGGTNTINTTAGTDLRIGVSITGSNFAGMDGAEVIEVNSALTAQQIKQIYEAGRSRFVAEVISKQPRNLYRYNEVSGNLIDYGALGNDGVWTGSPTYGVTSPVVTNEPNDKAMSVTASEEVAITSDIAGTTYSFMAMVKPTAVSGTQDIFDDGGGDGFRLNADKMSLFYSATEHDSNTTLVAGQAHLFGVSVDAGAVTFNLDGGDDGTASGAPLINPDTLFDSSFAGDADEAAIFNTALTDQDWLDIYEMASYSPTTFFGLQGNLAESLTATDFIISAFDKATHALLGTATIDTVADPTGAYQIPLDEAQGAIYYTAQADTGSEFVAGATYALDDYVYPTDVETDTDPHFYQVTVAGVAGSEPVWNKAGGTSVSGAVTFQDMGEIPTPVTHGPLNPVAS